MKTFTPEEFKQRYGEVGIAQFNQTPVEQKEPGYFSRVGQQIKGQFQEAKDSYTASIEQKKNPIYAGLNIAKNITGMAVAPIAQAPGLKQMGEGFGKAGQAIVDTRIGNKVTDVMSKAGPENLGAVSDVLETGLNVAAIQGTVKGGQALYNKGRGMVNKMTAPEPPPPPGTPPEPPNVTSANIMNRVARLKPTDATKFEQVAGKSHGQYLADTGNFGTPDKIITTESTKFVKSMNAVDAEFAKLPGTYKSAPMLEALKGLAEKAKTQSSGGIKAPFYEQVVNLIRKYKTGGLNMSEVNLLKRLYERNVKLGYNKLLNPDQVAQATNIDSALRKWQVKQAETLGFKNVGELNKQTQISKFIIDKLGDQVVGQTGLNAMGLTDWIMLAGGNPEAVAGFLTKKFFSSKAVQAKIAEIMADTEPTAPVTPDIGQSQIKQLPAPKPGSLQSQNFTPPRLPTRSLPNEGQASLIRQQVPQNVPLLNKPGQNPIQLPAKTSKPQSQQLPQTKLGNTSTNYSTNTLKEKGTIPENSQRVDSFVKRSAENQPMVNNISQTVANKYGLQMVKGPLKTAVRIHEKINRDYAGDYQNIDTLLKDGARNTILSPKKLQSDVVSTILKENPKATLKIQTREVFNGYEGNIVRVPMKNGLMAEIQVHTPEMMVAKFDPAISLRELGKEKFDAIVKKSGVEPGQGHKYYEIQQKAEENIIKGIDAENNILTRDKYIALQKEYYPHFY